MTKTINLKMFKRALATANIPAPEYAGERYNFMVEDYLTHIGGRTPYTNGAAVIPIEEERTFTVLTLVAVPYLSNGFRYHEWELEI